MLVGQVVEQLPWDNNLPVWTAAAKVEGVDHGAGLSIVEHIQQQLLGNDENAWTVFLGIAENGTPIGDIAMLANAIEHPDEPA